MKHCAAEVAIKGESSEVTGESLYVTPLIPSQLIIAFHSPVPEATLLYVSVRVVTCPVTVFLQADIK